MGDVKLSAFLGAGLGISVIVAMFVGFFIAFVPALVLFARHGKEARKLGDPARAVPGARRRRSRSSGETRSSTGTRIVGDAA